MRKNRNRLKKHKKIKFRKTILFFLTILVTYLLLIIFASKIETYTTFPFLFYKKNIGIEVIKDLKFEEINIKDSKGNNINGLYIDNKKEKTVYFFHGNGGSLDYFYNHIKYISDLGYNVMAYDFPGYGKSQGFPYEKLTYEFSDKFYNYVKKEKGLKDENVIIWGYSIGTALASDFVYKNTSFDKLILFAPLSSRYDMSKSKLGFILQKFLFKPDSYISYLKLKFISIPTLIIHGNKDEIIPFLQGKKVWGNIFSNNKYFIELDNSGHNFIIENFGEYLKYYIDDFLDSGIIEEDYIIINDEKKEYIRNKNKEVKYDFYNDSSLTKFVSSNIAFNDLSYVPKNLEKISGEYLYDSKGNSSLRKEALDSLKKMSLAFYNDLNEKIVIVSAYRSYSYQKGIKDHGCPDNLCAKAGYSEHQTGLAFDLRSASTNEIWKNNKNYSEYYNWLDKNAANFGFTNTYKKGLKIDTYEIEPWHWRYVGVELATYLQENNFTFAEYFNSITK